MKTIDKSLVVAGVLLGALNSLLAAPSITTINSTTSTNRPAVLTNWYSVYPFSLTLSADGMNILPTKVFSLDRYSPTTPSNEEFTSLLKVGIKVGTCDETIPEATILSFRNNTQYCAYFEVPSYLLTIQATTGNDSSSAFNNISTNVISTNSAPTITEGDTALQKSTDEDTVLTEFTLNATDAESDSITWSISSQASNGTATVTDSPTGESQAINYTPNEDFNGSDSFTVQAADDNGADTIVVNVTVNPINDAPVLEKNIDMSVAFSTSKNITTEYITISDIDDDLLNDVFFKITSLPTLGILKTSEGQIVNINDTIKPQLLHLGFLKYEAGESIGSDSFTFTIIDGEEDGAEPVTGTFNINVITPSVLYTNTLKESASNDGYIDGNVTITLVGDTFSTDVVTSKYVKVSNIPTGLTPFFKRDSDTQITMILADPSNSHTSSDNVSDINISFIDEAFVSSIADNITDSTKSDLTLSFIDDVITGLVADRWNMISFPSGYSVDTTKIDSSYITSGKDIKSFVNNSWVKNPTDLNATAGVWIHPTSTSIPFAGVTNTNNDFANKEEQLAYYKSLESTKWHLVSVQYAMNWSDLKKTNITPDSCDGYTTVEYYDSLNNTYNTTTNIPVGASIWLRHMCKGDKI